MRPANLFKAAALVMVVQGFAMLNANAQTEASVVAGCAGGGSCAAAVTSYVDAMRATGMNSAAINDALANLTIALANAAQTNPNARSRLSSGILAAAAATTDARRTQMVAIAQTIDAGDDLPATSASGS